VDERRQIEKVSNWFNASPDLRAWWKDLGTAARLAGFGRCETFPIISNAEGCARYVGGYVGKEFAMRQYRDKGLRTIRYGLKQRMASIRWSWANDDGRTWRLGCAMFAAVLGLDDLSIQLGKHWAWQYRKVISIFGRHPVHVGEQLQTLAGVVDVAARFNFMWDMFRVLEAIESAPEKTDVAFVAPTPGQEVRPVEWPGFDIRLIRNPTTGTPQKIGQPTFNIDKTHAIP
jgi:hypothetical protein